MIQCNFFVNVVILWSGVTLKCFWSLLDGKNETGLQHRWTRWSRLHTDRNHRSLQTIHCGFNVYVGILTLYFYFYSVVLQLSLKEVSVSTFDVLYLTSITPPVKKSFQHCQNFHANLYCTYSKDCEQLLLFNPVTSQHSLFLHRKGRTKARRNRQTFHVITNTMSRQRNTFKKTMQPQSIFSSFLQAIKCGNVRSKEKLMWVHLIVAATLSLFVIVCLSEPWSGHLNKQQHIKETLFSTGSSMLCLTEFLALRPVTGRQSASEVCQVSDSITRCFLVTVLGEEQQQ